MKTKIYFILAGLLLTLSVFAQAPQKMSFQAVIRNSSNALVTSTLVGMKISVLQGSPTGTVAYSETQSTTTNANGLVSLQIGSGIVVSGTFTAINWATGPYFIKTETDPTGGSAYSILGTSELTSVPYALFSANGTPGPIGLTGATGPQGPIGLTGGTGAAGTNAGVGGFTHYLGEAFNGGIIYYLYKGSDGLEHGLIVALTESVAVWQNTGTFNMANRTENGAYNTNLMTNSPAKTYIQTLGAGWYLPSIDELALLYYNRYSAQKGLRAGANTLLSSGGGGWNVNNYPNLPVLYWSSTELSTGDAYYFPFLDGYATYTSNYTYFKNNSYSVRGVRAF